MKRGLNKLDTVLCDAVEYVFHSVSWTAEVWITRVTDGQIRE